MHIYKIITIVIFLLIGNSFKTEKCFGDELISQNHEDEKKDGINHTVTHNKSADINKEIYPWDLEAGSGISWIEIDRGLTRSGKQEKSDSSYNYAKGRYRWQTPLQTGILTRIDVGLFLSAASGRGEMSEDNASYSFKRGVIGPTVEAGFMDELFKVSADIAYGQLNTESESCSGFYTSRQSDELLYFSSHIEINIAEERGENIEGLIWFPRIGIDAEYINTGEYFSSNSYSAYWDGARLPDKPADNSRYEVSSEFMLVDLYLLKDSGWRLTPGIKAGFGESKYGSENADALFSQAGLVVAIGNNWTDYLNISVLRRKQNVDGMSGNCSEYIIAFYINLAQLLR